MHHARGMSDFQTVIRNFIERVTAGASLRAVAEASGIDASTLSRQLARGSVPVQTVVAVCRAYDADLVDGFLAAGYITEEEAAQMSSRGSLRAATDQQLAQEILRRLQEGTATEALTDPLPEESHTADIGGRVIEGRFRAMGSKREFAHDAAAQYKDRSIFDEQEQGD